MDKSTRRYFSIGIIASFLMFAAFIAYYLYSGDEDILMRSMLGLIGVLIAILISYSLYISFSQSEKSVIFGPHERVILQRKEPEKATVLPMMPQGGFSPDLPPVDVNLYLTNIGILGESPPGSGQSVIYIPHDRIMEMQVVSRMFANYVRIQYMEMDGTQAEVLLYVGKDAEKWSSKIARLLTGMRV
jgi:hypothetical protein